MQTNEEDGESDSSIFAGKLIKLSKNIINTSELSKRQLQGTENWRGQNKKKMQSNKKKYRSTPLKRGKYLRAFPNITLIHNRPLRKRKDEIIKKW